jgi:hypothetical protein
MENRELIITHRIFLTKKQRYSLSEDGMFFTVKGKHLDVWKKGNKTNEPAEEKDCKYTIGNNRSGPVLSAENNNFTIMLPDLESRIGLLDYKDGGFKGFQFAYKEISEQNDTTHYIIVNDKKEMMASLL